MTFLQNFAKNKSLALRKALAIKNNIPFCCQVVNKIILKGQPFLSSIISFFLSFFRTSSSPPASRAATLIPNTARRREPKTAKSFRTGCLCSRAKSHHKTLKKQKYMQKFLLFFFSLFNLPATTTVRKQRKPLNIQAFSFLLHLL